VIQSHRGKYLAAHPEEARGTPVEKHWFTAYILEDSLHSQG